MSLILSVILPLAGPSSGPVTVAGSPMDSALRATEAPETFRAAFTVHLMSGKAERIIRFDPRAPQDKRWQLLEAYGEDSQLDEAAAAWGAEAAPDGRLFPDDLRVSLGTTVRVDDLGGAWRVGFKHAPSANDTALDIWATQRLDASAWLEPQSGRFMRIDYTLPRPVRGPQGGRLTKFEQTYLLESEPVWGLTYVAQYSIKFEAKAAFKTIRQSYRAQVSEAEFFFASPDAEDQFVEAALSAGAKFGPR